MKNCNLRERTLVALLVICGSLTASVEAQDDQGKALGLFRQYISGSDREPGDFLGAGYVNLDCKDEDLSVALKTLSASAGVNIIADANVKEKVTISVERLHWMEAMKLLAKQSNCKVVRVSPRLVRFTQPATVSMEFNDADLKLVVDLIAKQAGVNIVIGRQVEGKVSFSLNNVPWREALDTLVKTAGFVVVRGAASSSGDSSILRVVHPDTLKSEVEMRSFQLRYIRPSEPYVARMANIENLAHEVVGLRAGAEAKASASAGFPLEEALRQIVTADGGQLTYDSGTNTIIVKDTQPKLEEMAEIIKLLDVPPAQVHVEVKFIRTTNIDLLEQGVRFDDPSTPERDGFTASTRFITPRENPEFSGDPLSIFGGTFPFNVGQGGVSSLGVNGFQALGVLDLTQMHAFLRMVKDDERTQIVQEPSLTMLDNRPAVIFVGETIPFAIQQIQQDQNGNVTVAIEENDRSPINIGFTLYITPHVVPGTDEINLSIIPKVSTLSGSSSSIAGFERFAFSAPGSQTESFIDLPRESAQTVVTYMRVRDGQTAVIGGLQTEKRSNVKTSIPILAGIPLMGRLFSWNKEQAEVESLLIMITPRILNNSEQEEKFFRDRINKHREEDFFRKDALEGGRVPAETKDN
ncbi:MAG: secretin N-terminal domain-containing protein [Planctomycetota bacterium]